MYLYAKDPYQAKYQYLIKKHNKVGLKLYDDPKVFIKYSNGMQDVYKKTEEWNLGKKPKATIDFDDTFPYMINNKNLTLVVTEFFIRDR